MLVDTLLINGTIVTPEETYKGVIGIKEGKTYLISDVDAIIPAKEVIDLQGLYVLPGAIDAHIHFQDPGFTEREDIEHGTASAAAGGITVAFSHPLNSPPATTLENYAFTQKAYEGKAYVDYCIHGGATAENIDLIQNLWNNTGATAIKMFMCFSVAEFPFVQDESMYMVLEKLAQVDGLALIHAENDGLIKVMESRMKKEGRKDGLAYNLSHPAEAEIEAIQRALYFIEITGAKAVFLHVSTAKGLQLIHSAKEKGMRVYAESAPHLFAFTRDDMDEKGPYLKFSPVMHDEENQKKMWELIGKGYVDTIGSDHSPYTKEEKIPGEKDIWKAPNGIPGLETSLAVFLNGVNEGKLTLNQVARMTSHNPAKIYGIYPQKGSIQVGTDADFTIVDMNLIRTYQEKDIKSKCKWSPYIGMTLKGWPVMTIVRGKVIYKNGDIVGNSGYGKYIPRKRLSE
ncbi:MAG: hypothetical protein K0R31_704 [Clostridiales bacterium]|nr:hypothetical protein [Clostridiales bacterium]